MISILTRLRAVYYELRPNVRDVLQVEEQVAREHCEKTKANIFWSTEKEQGIRKGCPGRKDRLEKRKRKIKKAMGKRYSGYFQ